MKSILRQNRSFQKQATYVNIARDLALSFRHIHNSLLQCCAITTKARVSFFINLLWYHINQLTESKQNKQSSLRSVLLGRNLSSCATLEHYLVWKNISSERFHFMWVDDVCRRFIYRYLSETGSFVHQQFSRMMAMPWPPPMQADPTAYFPPRRLSETNFVSQSRHLRVI